MSWIEDNEFGMYEGFAEEQAEIDAMLCEPDEVIASEILAMGFYESDYTDMVKSILRQHDRGRELSHKQKKVLVLYLKDGGAL